MSKMRKLTAAGVVAALLATTATPAMAGAYGGISIGSGYGGYDGYGRRRHHGHDRVDAGDVIGAIAVVGIIAAIASAAGKSKSTSRRDRDDTRYPDARRDDRRSDSGRSGDINTEEAAIDACALAAEQQAGETASVRDITSVARSNNGWTVEGVVEQRDNWRDRSADKRRFTCAVRYGAVDDVRIDSGVVASRY
jgi:hypothetical protein